MSLTVAPNTSTSLLSVFRLVSAVEPRLAICLINMAEVVFVPCLLLL